MKILAVVYPGMTPIDLIAPLQALSVLPGAEVVTTWKSAGPVLTDVGASLMADVAFDQAWSDPDVLIIGGAGQPTLTLMDDEEVLAFVRGRAAKAQWTVSVCTGSLILAAAGLLRGRRAASYWAVRDYLAFFGAEVSDERVVIDGRICTGGGVTAGVDVGIAMAAEIAGEAQGRLVELLLEYAPQPPFGVGRPELADPASVGQVKAIVDAAMPRERFEAAAAVQSAREAA